MNKRYVVWLCALFVVLDVGYSYVQHYQLPLEGDLAPIVLPGPWYSQVLQDPFGWTVLTENKVYAGTNRYFAHLSMSEYLKRMPLFLQRFTDPITSVYVACAVFKTFVQILLLYLLAVYSTGAQRLAGRHLWLLMALLAPLFQAGGYNEQMGVIEQSITYTFFYAFPLALLLLLLLPFYRAACQQQPLRLRWPNISALVALMVVLAFNGPIVTGAVLVLLISVGLQWAYIHWLASPARLSAAWWITKVRQISWQLWLLGGLFTGLCLYSLYIGRNNAENLTHTLSVWERYKLLPPGILRQITSNLGFPLLLLACLINTWLLRRFLPPTPENRRLRCAWQLLGLFSLIYILLLPLGGYRIYRPLLLRRDSILPIILGLIYFYGASTYYLVQHLPPWPRQWYLGGVLLVGGIFMYADTFEMLPTNTCERQALQQLAQAAEPVVQLHNTCTVLAWEKTATPQQSVVSAQLLDFWGITQGVKLYYQQTATPSLQR